MYIIGLTGGIACGKSAVAWELSKIGAKTFDIDKVTHKLLEPGGELYETYVRHFKRRVVKEDGAIDREAIANIIFNNYKERQWINSVAHPVLLNHTRDFLVECAENGELLVVLEIPLLFEAGWEFLVDEIWAVYVSKSKQIWRLMQRDKISYIDAERRINVQMSAEEIAARADVVINNKKNHRASVRKKVLEIIYQRLADVFAIRRDNLLKKSEVNDLAKKNLCNDSDSGADNLRGDTVTPDATNVVSVPVP